MDVEKYVIELSLNNRNLYSVVLELNTICNWKCKHCYIPEHINKGLDTDEVLKLLANLRELGVFEITLTGGEIFLRKDIFIIIEEARKMGFNIVLFSNISLLTEEKIIKLKELYISEISCTIFSMNQDIHDLITGVPGSLKNAIDNLKILKKYNIPVSVKTILMSLNYLEWREINNFCIDNGFEYNIDHDIFCKSNGEDAPVKLRMTHRQLLKELKALDKFRGIKYKPKIDTEYVCDGIQNALFISSYGEVYPCTKFLFSLGNIKFDSISNIWNNSEDLIRIQNMKWKDLIECRGCDDKNYCVHCPGTSFLEHGSEYCPSLMSCEKAKIRANNYEK